MDLSAIAPSAPLLAAAVALDLVFGDPVYAWHPVRLMGRTLEAAEKLLRRARLDGYAGGCLLFLALAALWVGGPAALIVALKRLHPNLAIVAHALLLYSLLALRDLFDHALAVEHAAQANDQPAARQAIARLVGRDTAPMDLAACRRAAIESLSENFVDGFVSPMFWYALFGIPGVALFKVASTMDSMVGYKTPRYLRFGWCGARLDDLMNFLPARLSWLLIGAAAAPLPGCSARRAWKIGWRQHAVVPGPNSGWSEAAAAGALRCRLIGPIWSEGKLVTDRWLGAPEDPEGGRAGDVRRACLLTAFAAALSLLLFVPVAAACRLLS